MKIPIENIYFILCYAWNRLEEKDIVDVNAAECKDMPNLFARVLISGVNHLLKRGLDRNYTLYGEDCQCIRGRIDFQESIKRRLIQNARLHCEFDEFDYNVLHNQIIKSTLLGLIRLEEIQEDRRDEMLGIVKRLVDIQDIHITKRSFSRVHLHRNNGSYGLLLSICELIHDNLMIDENSGKARFRDFLRDETIMRAVFEEFLRNFYIMEQREFSVRREHIHWNLTEENENLEHLLPRMETDITLESRSTEQKIIIDAKYYQDMLVSQRESSNKKIRAAHLYQLYAYLKNAKPRNYCEGIVLYPKSDMQLDETFTIDGHKMRFATIDLSQKWQCIHNDLLSLIGVGALCVA